MTIIAMVISIADSRGDGDSDKMRIGIRIGIRLRIVNINASDKSKAKRTLISTIMVRKPYVKQRTILILQRGEWDW